MYDESSIWNETLYTGDFSEYVDPDMKRAGELDELEMPNTLPANYFGGVPEIAPELDRAGKMFEPYEAGDTYVFNLSDNDKRTIETEFECVYAGEKSNVWQPLGEKFVTKNDAKDMCSKFDSDIYDTDVELFGEPRFADNGHKVNILVHDLGGFAAGYFRPLDLLTEKDNLVKEVEGYPVNFDHAIIHVSYQYVGSSEYEETLYSTLAHEFQHLICFTDYCENGGVGFCNTWLNEAMSGYVEEYMFTGIQKQDGRYEYLSSSDRIRYGQSLYNFETTKRPPVDAGVYGSVFLFSEYLANIGGTDVFHGIHDYWRIADRGASDAAAIREALGSKEVKKIDKVITYPDGFVDLNEDEEFLSKLALDFYLSLLNYDNSDPKEYKDLEAQTLLYDQLDPADIEGGGRVIVATLDGTFEVPDDADDGLVYIGLDKDFNVITAPAFH